MATWAEYPQDYRQKEIQHILSAVCAGECVAIVGLSGAGKSNLTGFLANRCASGQPFVLVDCNRLSEPTSERFFQLVRRALGSTEPAPGGELLALEEILALRLAGEPGKLCLVFDRFDALPAEMLRGLTSNLRALRDEHKYRLTYVISTRQALDAHSELAELFYSHTLWLGVLSESDARWSIAGYARRSGQTWGEAVCRNLMEVSWRYPSLLRGACEAYAAGCPLEAQALRAHPAIQRRVEEFWTDQPAAEDIRRSGLEGQPLLELESSQLTAKEALLLNYLQAHPNQVCDKDDLVRAVWPEIKIFKDGIQDDSLSQLVRRLRRKFEPDPSTPVHIFNVPGRGYRYSP
jgi:hypothetical protein